MLRSTLVSGNPSVLTSLDLSVYLSLLSVIIIVIVYLSFIFPFFFLSA